MGQILTVRTPSAELFIGPRGLKADDVSFGRTELSPPTDSLNLNLHTLYDAAAYAYSTIAVLGTVNGAIGFCNWLRSIISGTTRTKSVNKPPGGGDPNQLFQPILLVEISGQWFSIGCHDDVDRIEEMLRSKKY